MSLHREAEHVPGSQKMSLVLSCQSALRMASRAVEGKDGQGTRILISHLEPKLSLAFPLLQDPS